jgi:dTDP-4-dehydrorhamnose reductase
LKILLLGNTGQLGWELERELAPLGELSAFDYPQIDMAEASQIHDLLRGIKPDLIINATAYTAVDRAENESERAVSINTTAPRLLAEAAKKVGAGFIHFSTDYVFDGSKGTPYLETDLPNPLNVYGRTKLAGEREIQDIGGTYLVLRTSWVYSMRRDNFVHKVLTWSRSQSSLKLVTDQVSGPTWSRMLAEATGLLIAMGGGDVLGWLSERHGLYHLGGAGFCSRFEWGKEILRLDPHQEQQVVKQLLPALSADFPSLARRPLFSALNCDHFANTFHINLPDWKVALKLAMEGI